MILYVNSNIGTIMCKNNSRDSSFLSGCSPLQNCNGLIGDSPAIGYCSYTQRSNYMRGFGGLLTKFYLSKVVQWWITKQGGTFLMNEVSKSVRNLTQGRYQTYFNEQNYEKRSTIYFDIISSTK